MSTPAERAGLRARNLERNRAEVAAIALELFDARGFDAVSVDDIAEASGISRRTFFRYFESKEGAVLPFEEERLELLREALATSEPGDSPLATVRRATLTLVGNISADEREVALRRMRIVHRHPAVHARSLEVLSQWENAVAEVIAEELGEDPSASLTAKVTAGAAVAAVRAATEVWLQGDGRGDLTALLAEAYDILAAGLTFSD